MRKKRKTPSPLKAIRLKCLECSCGSYTEIRECTVETCPLYSMRLGRDPERKGKGGKIQENLAKKKERENPDIQDVNIWVIE